MIGFTAAHSQGRQCPAAPLLADGQPGDLAQDVRDGGARPAPVVQVDDGDAAADGVQGLGDARSGDDDGFDVLRSGQGRTPEHDEHKWQQDIFGHVRSNPRLRQTQGNGTIGRPRVIPIAHRNRDNSEWGRSPDSRGFPGHFLPRPRPSGLRVPLAYRCGGSAGFAFAHRLPCFICRADTPSRRWGQCSTWKEGERQAALAASDNSCRIDWTAAGGSSACTTGRPTTR